MDSQIGSDIAKLLGNLGKSEVSGAKSASSGEAGMAFKRTLAASVQAQAAQTGGKGLPVTSDSEGAALPASAGVSAAAVAAQHAVEPEPIVTTVLPEFDLHVVGAPAERLAVMKFAEEAGLSEEVLAQVFASAEDDSAPIPVGATDLAEAIAGAITQWIATQQTQADRATSAGGESLSQTADSKGEPVTRPEGDTLSKLITPALQVVTQHSGASPAELAEQLAADIKPVLQASVAGGAQSSASAAELSQTIVDVVKPSIALWINSQGDEFKRASVSIDAVAQNIALTISSELRSVPSLSTTELKRELEAAVAQWVKASPSLTGISISDAWIRDAAQKVAPAVSEWIAVSAVSGRQSDQLVAQISPQVTQALGTLGETTGAASFLSGPGLNTQPPSSAMVANTTGVLVGLEGVSETQLRVVRDNVVAHPQPISLTVMGSELEFGRSAQQALTQVVAPPSRPAAETLVLPQSAATLDRFALRGAGLRPDGVGEITKKVSSLNPDGSKADKIDSMVAVRDLVSARSLELARLASSGDKPLVASSAQQSPFAGLVQGEVGDAAARPVASSEFSLRQSLAGAERAAISDAGRLNQFALNQNTAARELASRHLSEALGQRLAANIAAGHYRLTFNVNPRELGAIDVVMEMRDGRLDAQINASNAVTRDLLGDSLPRLRDALQQNGINLAQLQVGSDSQQGNAQGRQASDEQPADQGREQMRLTDVSDDLVSEDLELGLDLDSVDFWA